MNCAIHTETPAAAYCRTCGKALCESCKRDVLGTIYCEPCLAARVQGAGPAASVPGVRGAPNPAIAAWLGFIPGVGAMYNDQFMKALIHVAIFVVLVTLSSHMDAFGIVVFFFLIYMAFDAHKTAQARQLGLPAPDFLGLERVFGIHENWGRHAHQPAGQQPAPDAEPSSPASAPPLRYREAPIGAIVLIALGVLFLLGNFHIFEFWRIWRLWPLVLIVLGLRIAYRRTLRRA